MFAVNLWSYSLVGAGMCTFGYFGAKNFDHYQVKAYIAYRLVNIAVRCAFIIPYLETAWAKWLNYLLLPCDFYITYLVVRFHHALRNLHGNLAPLRAAANRSDVRAVFW